MPSCESGYTYPEPNNHRFVWGTCYAAHVATFDEINSARRSVSPWMHTLDQRSGRPEVPLPVVAAARDRLVRQLGVLRLPGDLPHRAIADRAGTSISPDLSTRRSRAHSLLGRRRRRQPRPVLRRRRLRDRAVAHDSRAWSGPARTTARCWITRDAGKKWIDLTEEREDAAVGLVRRIDASHLRSGDGLHGGGLSPRRSARSVSSSRPPTYGQTWTRLDAGLPKGHPLDYALSIAENPHRRGMIFAGTGHGVLLLARRREDVEAVQGQAAGGARELDRSAEERGGSRGRDVRPRALDPARRLAARAAGDRRGGPFDRLSAGGQPADLASTSRVPACAPRGAGSAAIRVLAARGAHRADHDGDSERRRRRSSARARSRAAPA